MASGRTTQYGSVGSTHWASFTGVSSRYQSGKPSSGSMVGETLASPPVPVPETGTFVTPSSLLFETSRVARCSAAVNGANITVTSQVPVGAIVRPPVVHVSDRSL